MKKFRTTIFALGTIILLEALILSCTKEQNAGQKQNESGVITVSVNGELGELVTNGCTKSDLANPIRLKWVDTDKVYAFDGATCLGELSVSLKDGKDYYAVLEGELNAPAKGTEKITLVHAPGFSANTGSSVIDGELHFDLSSQNGTLASAPFVAFATMDYNDQSSISDLVVNFTFATSFIRMNCSGLDAGIAFTPTIKGMSNECVLKITNAGASVVPGEKGDIKLSVTSASSSGAKTLYAGLAKTSAKSDVKVSVRQDWKTFDCAIANSSPWQERQAYNAICPLKPYVEIEADYDQDPATPNTKLKWFYENLAISDSGKRVYKNSGHTNGDYFHWGAHKGYCGNESDADMGLLIYESFNHYYCVAPPYGMIFKSAGEGKTYWFDDTPDGTHEVITPYYTYTGSTYTSYYEKYNESDGKVTLEESDDVAHIILGGSWRMPTSKEFQALYNVTYWAYDATDRGYYVYTPNPSTDAGKVDDEGEGTYNKADALIFFPFSGYTGHLGVSTAGDSGNYLSSTVQETNSVKILYMDYIVAYGYGQIFANGGNHRYQGGTVRSVSE